MAPFFYRISVIATLSSNLFLLLSLYRLLKNIAYRAITVIAIALRLISSISFLLGNSIPNILTRIRRVRRIRSGREKLMRTRVAQIRRKTDYLQGAISRLTLARGVFFDGARIDNKAINGRRAISRGETKAKREV